MKKIVFALLSASMLFTGCNTSTTTGEGTQSKPQSAPPVQTSATTQTMAPTEAIAPEAQKRVITTYKGDVEIPANPKKVVLLAKFLDYAVNLEQDVVGALSEASTYETDVPPYLQGKVNEGVTYFKFTNDPDLEAVTALKPDLIIGYKREGNEKVYDQLSMIAPTILMEHEWGNLEQALGEFGKVLGKKEKADEVLTMYKAKADEYAKQIHTVVGEDEDVMFLRVSAKNYRVYGQTGQTKRVLNDDLKLKPLEGFPESEKWLDVSMEGIFAFNPDHIIIDVDNDENAAAMMEQLNKSEVWNNLEAVKSGHVYTINDFLESTLGPTGSVYAMENLSKQMTKK